MNETLLINGQAAAKLIGVNENALKKLREQGGLPFVILSKRAMYRVEDVRRWLDSKTKTLEPSAA